MRFAALACLVLLAAPIATAHEPKWPNRAAPFPALADGRLVLKADLHTHSVFSDGSVWPTIRVEEAMKDGLDALAVTEHLEHQPHKADIPHPDRNRAHGVADAHAKRVKAEGLIVINGAEVTREMPPGHINAVFLKDANPLLAGDVETALRAAKAQGAFIFWNHPNWLPQAPDGVARLTDMHRRFIKAGLLQGVEVANGTLDAYSEHAFAIALEHNLTVLGTSDIHGLVDWTHNAGHGGHRPMTLVLAKARTAEALQEGLVAGTTVAWHNDDLIGREAHVRDLVRACLSLTPGTFSLGRTVLPVTLTNRCPLPFTLRNRGEQTFHNVTDVVRVEREASIPLQVRMGAEKRTVTLRLEVLNTQVRPREPLTLELQGAIPTMAVP